MGLVTQPKQYTTTRGRGKDVTEKENFNRDHVGLSMFGNLWVSRAGGGVISAFVDRV